MPQFLQLRGVGLNISDHSVKMIDLQEDDPGLVPDRFDVVDIPGGAVMEGDIKDPDAVSEVLRKLKHRHDLEQVRLSIPEENGYIFNAEIPSVNGRQQLKEAVSLRLEEEVPMPSDSVVFDFDLTHRDDDGTCYVTVSVLPEEIVGEYMQICQAADLHPLSFEIEAQTIARAVVPKDSESAVMIIDIGKSRTGIFIVDAGTVVYTSTLQVGGDHLTEAIAEATDRSIEEAETYKQEQGFVRNSKRRDEFQALHEAADTFVDEAVRRFRYWHSNPTEVVRQSGQIEKVLLVGGNASVPGLADHISAELDVPVAVGDVWKNAFDINEHVPAVDFRHSLTYTAAIGLALSEEV